MRSLAVLLGPALFALTFAFFIDGKRSFKIPGAPWYLGGALLFIGCLLSVRIGKTRSSVRQTSAHLPDIGATQEVISG